MDQLYERFQQDNVMQASLEQKIAELEAGIRVTQPYPEERRQRQREWVERNRIAKKV